MKKPIVKYYSMSSVLAMEPAMNEVIGDFCGHLERRFMQGDNEGKVFDLGQWIAFCKSSLFISTGVASFVLTIIWHTRYVGPDQLSHIRQTLRIHGKSV